MIEVIFAAELWMVAAAVLAGMIWFPALIIAPLLGIIYALLHLIIEKHLAEPTPADLSILFLIVVLPINLLLTHISSGGTNVALRLLGGIALFYAVVNWCQTTSRARWLIAFTGMAALGLSTLSLIDINWTKYTSKFYFIPSSIYQRLLTITRDTVHPNVLAGSLIAFIPLILCMTILAIKKGSVVERRVYPLLLICTTGSLLLTQSRSALLALVIAAIITLILLSPWFWTVPLIGLAAATAWMLRSGFAVVMRQMANFTSLAGLDLRLKIWQRDIFILQDFPLTGAGIGNFPAAFRMFYPMSLDQNQTAMPHAHNMFLQVGADLGIPGLIIWLGVAMAAIIAAWEIYRRGKKWQNAWLSALGAGLLGCQLAILIHGMFDAVMWGDVRTAPLVWWIWGLTMAALNLIGRAHKRGTRPSSNLINRPTSYAG